MSARSRARAAVWRWLPRGGNLPDADWLPRHRIVASILALQLPVVAGYALATGHGPLEAGIEVLLLAALLGLALAARLPRRVRALAAVVGLVVAAGTLVELSDGAAVPHLLFVVAVGVAALYEQWPIYLVAFGAMLVEHALIGAVRPSADHDGTSAADAVATAATYAGVVLAATLAPLAFWRSGERSRALEARYRQELYEGQRSLQAELNRITSTREDLLATVSHEFRTPLTAIRGAALTMRKHRARLTDAKHDELLDAVLANTDRLSRLLENMLTAAEVRQPDRSAVTNVYQVATEVAMLVHAAHAERTPHVAVAIDSGIEAVVERSALHQILANLLDNAIVHAAPGSQAIVSGAYDGDDVVITVANEAHGVDARTLAGLFEPFTQADGSITRPKQGAGVGLYVVRRLIEVSNGTLTVHSQPGWVSVEVRLPRAEPSGFELTSLEPPPVTTSG